MLLAGSKGGKVMVAKGDASGGKPKNPKGTCWRCGKKGHYERDCRSKKTEKGGQSLGGLNPNAAASNSRGKNASSDKQAGHLRRSTATSGGIRV